MKKDGALTSRVHKVAALAGRAHRDGRCDAPTGRVHKDQTKERTRATTQGKTRCFNFKLGNKKSLTVRLWMLLFT